ncbi:hypothetical protein FLBR109950_15920 [Flavobacterium branchiophilum]|uniref:Uncharacterized protein n=2 Tax=Flavobacterium branchiophilum TaxID=55197 RepID=G2Z283_FLABF|nr:hypothetical protein [Flavobacterium branchiophilum]CCB70038.1 Hypothetical protein FBFL15_2003 [Flavobacterium branchiophilum FL-15]
MKNKIIAFISFIAIFSTLIYRVNTTRTTINGESFYFGFYKFEIIKSKDTNNNKIKEINIIDYTYSTYYNQYHIDFRVPLNDVLSSDFINFGEKNNTNYLIKNFLIRNKYNTLYFEPKNNSLKMRIEKISNHKYKFYFDGLLYSINNKDSIKLNSFMFFNVED